MPELTLWIGDDLAESPAHLENLLGRGGLTHSRADERVPETNPVVGDPDQVRVNSGLKGFDAGSAGPRDLVQGRSAVERCRQEGCPRGRGKLAKPVGGRLIAATRPTCSTSSRRAMKAITFRVERSSHCASSTINTSGTESATSQMS